MILAVARADDIVAEVFLVAWRRLDDIPTDTGRGCAASQPVSSRTSGGAPPANMPPLGRLEPPAARVDPAESPALANRPIQDARRNLSETDAKPSC